MEGVCKELDEARAEMEKLEEECRIKVELYEKLRKVYNEQLNKYHEAELQIHKQAQELKTNAEEISEVRQKYDELNYSLHEKETSLRNLSFAHDKLRVDFGERIQKMEGENKEMVLALDAAVGRNQYLERKICASNEEVAGLKRQLLVAQEKCLETELRAQEFKELKLRDDMILKLEEESSNAQGRLKWRNEQFEHLEEAHERLHSQLQSTKSEWNREKSMLLEEISSVQARLDSQERISESLQTQLKMCNRALAHEESRRKFLEVEVLELKSRFENVILECQEAKSKFEHVALKRDEEIAELRSSLGRKETLSKVMEYKIAHLEQQNLELLESLKDFRETQINKSGASVSKKLQNKLRALEQLHGKCSLNLKEKEAEWSSQIDKVTRDRDTLISELKGKDTRIQELQMELEGYHSSLDVQDVEIAVVTLVLVSELSEAYSKLSNLKDETEFYNKEREEIILSLTKQLEMKDSALQKLHSDIEEEHKEIASLVERVESLDRMTQQPTLAEEELEKHKAMVHESFECELRLKEKAIPKLVKKINEVSEIEFELQKWKSISQNLRSNLEENKEVQKQENERLLGIIKEQNEKICDFQQQVVLLESVIATKTEAMEACKQEKENYLRIVEDRGSSIIDLQKEINELSEALDGAKNVKNLEVVEKNIIITELEKEVSCSLHKLMQQEEQMSYLKQQVEQLEASLEAKKQELERLKDHYGNEQRCLKGRVKELEAEKEVLLEDITKVFLEREDLLIQVVGMWEKISEFSVKDIELIGVLEKILQKTEGKGLAMKLNVNGGLDQCSSKHLNPPIQPSRKGIGKVIDHRPPLKELNH